jgi:uncharacterized protein YhfF
MTNIPIFKKGQKVIFDSYGEDCKCTIREVDVKRHLFHDNGRTYYSIEGEAESICTAALLGEDNDRTN